MKQFKFSMQPETFELPNSYEEELVFAIMHKYPLAVYINRKFMDICVFNDKTCISAFEFNKQFNSWMKDFKINCPKSVYMQQTRKDPDTYAVCIHNKWIKNKYVPD